MPRLQATPKSQVPSELQTGYARVTKAESGLAATFQSLFANPQVASGLAGLDELVGRIDLEPWVTLTVALTVVSWAAKALTVRPTVSRVTTTRALISFFISLSPDAFGAHSACAFWQIHTGNPPTSHPFHTRRAPAA